MNSNHYTATEAIFKSAIHSIWQVDHFTPFQSEQIMPKGVVEIIFNFSDNLFIPATQHNIQYHLSKCFINGFNKSPLKVQLPKKHVFFGIVFHPQAIKRIFKIPASAFSDSTVDLAMIAPSFNSLWHQLAEQTDFNSRVNVFLGWVKRNAIEWQPQEQMVNDFLFKHDQSDLSVSRLANSLCYSPRHLSRKLFDATGMNTEELLLYKKYLHALQLLHNTDLSLTAIAYQSRFSDQSHFIRSFKTYTTMTPGAYKRRKGYVMGHIFE